jgi:hypothetical protein
MSVSYRLRLHERSSQRLLVATDHESPEKAGRLLARWPAGEHDYGATRIELYRRETGQYGEVAEREADEEEIEQMLAGVDAEWQESDHDSPFSP